jgi:hypothetical protein
MIPILMQPMFIGLGGKLYYSNLFVTTIIQILSMDKHESKSRIVIQ